MADIFEEVEEGIRKDIWTERWRKYGIFAYLGAALLIGGTALNEYAGYASEKALRTNGELLDSSLAALDERDIEEATRQLQVLMDANARLSPAASQFMAQIKYETNGDIIAAASILAESAGSGEKALERLALIKSAYLQADILSREELAALVAPLRADQNSAFNALAVELLAAKALADGDYAYAREEFGYLRVAANVPQGTLDRANSALAALPGLELAAASAEAAAVPTLAAPDTLPVEETPE